jgi:hypothetical protein
VEVREQLKTSHPLCRVTEVQGKRQTAQGSASSPLWGNELRQLIHSRSAALWYDDRGTDSFRVNYP